MIAAWMSCFVCPSLLEARSWTPRHRAGYTHLAFVRIFRSMLLVLLQLLEVEGLVRLAGLAGLLGLLEVEGW